MRVQYLRVAWDHHHPNEPTTLYSECDDDGWERRKVEVFKDSRMGFAGQAGSAGGTRLSEHKLPSFAEITAQETFRPVRISEDEFETAWRAAQHSLERVA